VLRTCGLGCDFANSDQSRRKGAREVESGIGTTDLLGKGPELFRAHCAACHGSDAKGGGPMALALKAKVPDLTVLAKKNGGRFPSARVSYTIMGDGVVMSHGSREMPIWGPIFHQIESDQDFGAVRLQNLVKYLESIQAK
jgi:mono/diheme cytochrome c family protein